MRSIPVAACSTRVALDVDDSGDQIVQRSSEHLDEVLLRFR
jgi:hypothetical protein